MLSGKQIILRAIEKEDLEELRIWRNNPNLRKYFREFRELSKTDQLNWYEKVALPKDNTLMFAITDKETSRLLGASGLCYIDWLRRSADLSIYIGYKEIYLDDKATEAANLLIKYAFEELALHRLWAEVYSHDKNKQEFFTKLQFNLDGKFRESHWTEGQWIDSLYYSLLSTDKRK